MLLLPDQCGNRVLHQGVCSAVVLSVILTHNVVLYVAGIFQTTNNAEVLLPFQQN